MKRVSKFIGLLTALPLVWVATLAIAEDMEVAATIQEVSEESNSLTVEFSETGVTQTFRIDEETEISFENTGRAVTQLRSGIEDLRAGQQVMLRFDDDVIEDEWVVLHVITIS